VTALFCFCRSDAARQCKIISPEICGLIMQNFSAPVADPQLDALKLPPHSVEAEQSVLGGILLTPAHGTRSPIC